MGTILFYIIFFAILIIVGVLEKNVGKAETISILLGFVIFLAVSASLAGFNWGRTYTGDIRININDCRLGVNLKQGDWETYWHKFYCSDEACVAISMNDGHCDTVYGYALAK